MNVKQKTVDKTYTYLKNLISILSIIGVSKLKIAVPLIDLVYKNLQWAGILQESINEKQQKELVEAINYAYEKMISELSKDKADLMKRAFPGIEAQFTNLLQNGFDDIHAIGEELGKLLQDPSIVEGQWMTPNDFDYLVTSFLTSFKKKIRDNSNLASIICLDRVIEIEKQLGSLAMRVANLEINQVNTSEDKGMKIITHLPNRPTAYYINRSDIEEDLCRGVIKNKALLISSMGGIGKTQICRYLFHKYLVEGIEDINCIGYLNYNGNEDDTVYNGIVFEKTSDYESDVQKAWAYLLEAAQRNKMILIIDDIRPTNEKGVHEKIEFERLNRLHCGIIFASRETTVPGFKRIPLDFMPREHCVSLFKSIYGRDIILDTDNQLIQEIIVNKLGRHTLAIHLVASSAKEFEWDAKKLIRKLESEHFCIEQGDSEENIQNEFVKLYKIMDFNESQINILRTFSIFPYIPLDISICTKWLYLEGGIDEDHLCKYMNYLANINWLQRSLNQQTGMAQFSMHPIVSSAVQGQSTFDYNNNSHVVVNCYNDIKWDDCDVFTKVMPFTPFAEALAIFFASNKTIEIGKLFNQLGLIYYELGKYQDSIKWCEKSVKIIEEILGNNLVEISSSYTNLALSLHKVGDYTKALELYNKAKIICEQSNEIEQIINATIYNNIAAVYMDLCRYSEALPLVEKALEIRLETLGRDNIKVASSYNNIASIYYKQGDTKKAFENYQIALEIYKDILDESHPESKSTFINISSIYSSLGNYQEAIDWSSKALKKQEDVFGEEHPETANMYSHIGAVYFQFGDYPEALRWNIKALEIHKKSLPENHINIINDYSNIASIYGDMGCFQNALKEHQRVFEMRVKIWGYYHAEIADTCNNIASMYYNEKNYEQSLVWHFKAIDIRVKIFNENHTVTASSYLNIAAVYIGKGDLQKAEKYCFDALDIYEKVYDGEHPKIASALNTLAGVFHCKKQLSKALDSFIKASLIYEKTFGVKHPDTAITYINIASVYEEKKDFSNALVWFNKGLSIREQVLGVDHPHTADTYNCVAKVYESQQVYHEAAKFYYKALRVYKKANNGIHINVAYTYYCLAENYMKQMEPNSALENYTKFLNIVKELQQINEQSIQSISLMIEKSQRMRMLLTRS